MRPKAVVLLSGGLDSTSCAAWAQTQGYDVCALTIHYGQRHVVEISRAERVCAALGIAEHRVVHLGLTAIGGSALTSNIDVPKGRSVEAMQAIPLTYVPARNATFLSIALGYAEVVGAQDLVIGVNAVDYSGYPDCRPEFIAAFEHMAQLATKAGVEGRAFRVHAPLTGMDKAQIIRQGMVWGAPLELTHSCYDPVGELACGTCDSCILRRSGFEAAGVVDPTQYV